LLLEESLPLPLDPGQIAHYQSKSMVENDSTPVSSPVGEIFGKNKAAKAAQNRANLLKLKTEQYYINLVQETTERSQRYDNVNRIL